MGIDIKKEDLLSAAEAGESFREILKKTISTRTIQRWMHEGLKSPRGFVQLDFIRIGGANFTSSQAINRFIASLNPPRKTRVKVKKTSSKQGQTK